MTISSNCPAFLCLFIDLSGHVHWTVRPKSPVDKLSGRKMSQKRTGKWPENDRKIHQKIWILGMVLSSHVRPDNMGECKALNKGKVRQMQQEIVLVKESIQRIEAKIQGENGMLRDLLHEIQWQQEEWIVHLKSNNSHELVHTKS